MTVVAGQSISRVLITGAAGLIGTHMRKELAGIYPVLRLLDMNEIKYLVPGEESVVADVADAVALEQAMAGVDAVVHLAAASTERPFPEILSANVIGTYNLYEAARRQGVQRVVYASSNHAVGFYPRDRRIGASTPLRPDSRYGLGKAWGELVATYYADKFAIRSLVVRIGNANDQPIDLRRLSIWISWRDLAQLIRIGLDHPDIHCDVVYGVSDNARGWYDNASAFRLGYRPMDQAEDHTAAALAAESKAPQTGPAAFYMGGEFCAMEYAGDRKAAYD